MAKHGTSLPLAHIHNAEHAQVVPNSKFLAPLIATSRRSAASQAFSIAFSQDTNTLSVTSTTLLILRSSLGKRALSRSLSMIRRRSSRMCKRGLIEYRRDRQSRISWRRGMREWLLLGKSRDVWSCDRQNCKCRYGA
jgi:hypothetical protein